MDGFLSMDWPTSAFGESMPAPSSTYNLPLTREQAEHLLRLVSVGELAIAEHNRAGWLPSGAGDATLMKRYLEALRTGPSLERPFRELGVWLRKPGSA